LPLLPGNLVRSDLLQAGIGFRLTQAAQLRSKLLQDGIGIGTRLFQQLNGIMRPVPTKEVAWALRCVQNLL
jgi:hypothetical protein